MAAHDNYRKNRRIRVPEVRLIDENGEQVGVVKTQDAMRRAQDADLDLVEVSPQARPPVCKIMDYGKFKYEQRKKDKKNRNVGAKNSSHLKELRVRPAIDDHDLSYRLDNGRRFLLAGHKVQVVCIFRGRQMAHPEHGYNVMKKVAENLSDLSKVEAPARMIGRRMTMLLSPLPASKRRKVEQQTKSDEGSKPDKPPKPPKAEKKPEVAAPRAPTPAAAPEKPKASGPSPEAKTG